jgi:hypothetical protein
MDKTRKRKNRICFIENAGVLQPLKIRTGAQGC